MKIKLKKTDHLHKFQLVNKISRIKLTTNENKSINGDSLIFHVYSDKLYILAYNGISFAYHEICDFTDNFVSFAVDSTQFTNAFSNFPSDEVQFAYLAEENQLVFGNKKTRVSLKTSPVNDFAQFELFMNLESWQKLDHKNLIDCIHYTSFSCAPDFDEYPYTSILFFISKKFNAQSSDKHRISIYGDVYESQKSYLISKTNAELLVNFLKADENLDYCIEKGKFNLKWSSGGFYTSLDQNTYESVFKNFTKFFNESELIGNLVIDKNTFIKSLRFIQNTTNTNTFTMKIENNELVLMSSNNEKGAVADKIDIQLDLPDINVEYMVSHYMKIFEIVPEDEITISFHEYNNYTISIIQSSNYNHLVFPMA